MMKRIRNDYIGMLSLYISAVVAVVLLSLIANPVKGIHFGLILPQEKAETPSIYSKEAFAGIHLKAKAYVVYDLVDKKIIASKNENEVLTLASVSKIMTAITALAHSDISKKLTIHAGSIDEGYDLGLKEGQVWKLGELLKYTLVFSSNDGAQIIADELMGREKFVAQMNTDAALLGLHLVFTQPAGLDLNGKLGGQGSALDVAKLFAIARSRFPEILDATTKTRATVSASTGKLTGVPNTNQDIGNLLGVEASKTGFTDDAGGNLVVVVDIAVGHPVVMVVLGSTHEERFTDMETLYHALQNSLKQ